MKKIPSLFRKKYTAKKLEKSYGIPIVNKRVSVTPVSFLASAFTKPTAVPIAKALDKAAKELGIA